MLQSVTECSRVFHSVTECYRVLHSVTEYYRVLQSIRALESFTQNYRVLQSITEYCRVLQSVSSASTWTNFWACFLRFDRAQLEHSSGPRSSCAGWINFSRYAISKYGGSSSGWRSTSKRRSNKLLYHSRSKGIKYIQWLKRIEQLKFIVLSSHFFYLKLQSQQHAWICVLIQFQMHKTTTFLNAICWQNK